ncbi:MAG TPA: DUF6789 family protein [Candidatus Dormibacteraeota bacterium]
MKSLLRGATAGTVATALMSALMVAARRLGITGQLPPEKITSKMLRRHGIRPDAGQQDALATGLHFAFGAAAGAAFGVIARRVPVPSVPLGVAYGTAIWGVSYMGWVPSIGLMQRADRDQRGRQAVMLAGHLVFGATLGVLAGRKARRPDPFESEEGADKES